MQNDLLAQFESENLPMLDADVKLWRYVDLGQDSNRLLQQLIGDSIWRQEKITVYGKPYLQPRLSAWHGDLAYSYSGIRLEPLPWTPILLDIRRRVESLVEHDFNSVLLNYYRDQKDRMGMHSAAALAPWHQRREACLRRAYQPHLQVGNGASTSESGRVKISMSSFNTNIRRGLERITYDDQGQIKKLEVKAV